MFKRLLLGFLMAPLFLSSLPAYGASLDAGVYATYNTSGDKTQIYFTVCGSIGTGEGCFGGGTLGPVGRAGMLIEGNPSQNTKLGTVTRFIYLLDIANGSGGKEVALYVYKRVDTIDLKNNSDSVTVSLFKIVSLALSGGTTATPFMAANGKYIFIGTDQGGVIAEVTKSGLGVTNLNEETSPVNTITSDSYGFVTLGWSDGNFEVIGPNNAEQEFGGGGSYFVNTTQGTVPLPYE
jgi:hypothetical protein